MLKSLQSSLVAYFQLNLNRQKQDAEQQAKQKKEKELLEEEVNKIQQLEKEKENEIISKVMEIAERSIQEGNLEIEQLLQLERN